MVQDNSNGNGRIAVVSFTGQRSDLFGLLLRSYLLMVPTLGIYRFWLVTWKRRFYWQNTEIDGDPLEYTGSAVQLLIGFMFAVLVFLPLYGLFFYLSIQTSDIVIWGYLGVGVLLWFLTGYAIYRARDFRLSRTLWRGIRFDQRGSAWGYAFRRFGWSILMVVTAGLVYPFMAANLWRYRYRHTWFGDRQFGFTGSWKQLAGPYYLIYFLVAVLASGILAHVFGNHAYVATGDAFVPSPEVFLMAFGVGLIGWLGMYYYQGREVTRMFSSVRCGEAAVTVRVRGRALLGQFLLYSLALAGALFIGGLFVGGLAASLFASQMVVADGDAAHQFAQLLKAGFWPIAVLIGGYLLVLATFALFAEVFLGFGYWMLVARGATITNADSLNSVRAGAEDPSLAGEGLADALNVGAY